MGLGDGDLDEGSEGAVGELFVADEEDARKGGEQWVEGARVAAEKATGEGGGFAAAARLDDEGELGAFWAPVFGEVGVGAQARGAGHDVRITLREDDEVAGVEPHGLFAHEAAVAGAGDEQVVLDDVLGARHDKVRDIASLGGLCYPRCGGVHVVEAGAGEAHGAQDVGEGVRAHAKRAFVMVRPGVA